MDEINWKSEVHAEAAETFIADVARITILVHFPKLSLMEINNINNAL